WLLFQSSVRPRPPPSRRFFRGRRQSPDPFLVPFAIVLRDEAQVPERPRRASTPIGSAARCLAGSLLRGISFLPKKTFCQKKPRLKRYVLFRSDSLPGRPANAKFGHSSNWASR